MELQPFTIAVFGMGAVSAIAAFTALILHDRSGAKHTPAAEAIFRGDAALDWGQST